MKKTFLILLLLIISISSISQEIPLDKKQYLLQKSYGILEFIYEDDKDFVRNPIRINFFNKDSIKSFLGENEKTNGIFIEYTDKYFSFEFFRGKIVKFNSKNKTKTNLKVSNEFKIKKAREFLRKFRPDLDDIFLFPKVVTSNRNIFNIVFFYYFQGFPSIDWANLEINENGKIKYLFFKERGCYKVPDKIITYEKAKEYVKKYINNEIKKKKEYWVEKVEDYNIVELNMEQKKKYASYGLSVFDHTKPIFLHPNTSFGKYTENIEEYGYKKENFRYNNWNWANFVRLSYIIWIDKPIVHFDSNYSGLIVDAETGEIIGWM